jgi:hypothetical protein
MVNREALNQAEKGRSLSLKSDGFKRIERLVKSAYYLWSRGRTSRGELARFANWTQFVQESEDTENHIYLGP